MSEQQDKRLEEGKNRLRQLANSLEDSDPDYFFAGIVGKAGHDALEDRELAFTGSWRTVTAAVSLLAGHLVRMAPDEDISNAVRDSVALSMDLGEKYRKMEEEEAKDKE